MAQEKTNNSSNESQGASFADFLSNSYSTALLLENYDLSKESKLWYGIVFIFFNGFIMGLTGLVFSAIYDDKNNYLTTEFFKNFSTVIITVSISALVLLLICSFISKLYLSAKSFSSIFSLLSIQTAFFPVIFVIFIYDSQIGYYIKSAVLVLAGLSIFFIKSSIDESQMKDVSLFRKIVVYIFSVIFFICLYCTLEKMMFMYI